MARLGIDVTGHVARLATASDVAHADLVLGFELAHLARARQLGAPAERTFTLPDLARTVEQVPYERRDAHTTAQRAREIVAWAHRHRLGTSGAVREIRDPLRAGPARSLETAREVHYHASVLVGYLFDTAPSRSTRREEKSRGYPAAGA